MLYSPMVESMDIAFLFVNISSTNFFYSTITRMISSIINPLLEKNYDIRLALIKSKSDDELSEPIVHSFTQSIVSFRQWFVPDLTSVTQHIQTGTMAICDVLRTALQLDWRTTASDQCHENIVFLITDSFPCSHQVNPIEDENDDYPCACDDLWSISNTFAHRNLTLMIIGVGQIVSVCDNLYGTIAKNTGGEYIPLTNAIHVLFIALQSIITHGYTLSQSLRHIKQEEFEKNSSYHYSIVPKENHSKIKHCQMMAQKGAWLLNHFQQAKYL